MKMKKLGKRAFVFVLCGVMVAGVVNQATITAKAADATYYLLKENEEVPEEKPVVSQSEKKFEKTGVAGTVADEYVEDKAAEGVKGFSGVEEISKYLEDQTKPTASAFGLSDDEYDLVWYVIKNEGSKIHVDGYRVAKTPAPVVVPGNEEDADDENNEDGNADPEDGNVDPEDGDNGDQDPADPKDADDQDGTDGDDADGQDGTDGDDADDQDDADDADPKDDGVAPKSNDADPKDNGADDKSNNADPKDNGADADNNDNVADDAVEENVTPAPAVANNDPEDNDGANGNGAEDDVVNEELVEGAKEEVVEMEFDEPAEVLIEETEIALASGIMEIPGKGGDVVICDEEPALSSNIAKAQFSLWGILVLFLVVIAQATRKSYQGARVSR